MEIGNTQVQSSLSLSLHRRQREREQDGDNLILDSMFFIHLKCICVFFFLFMRLFTGYRKLTFRGGKHSLFSTTFWIEGTLKNLKVFSVKSVLRSDAFFLPNIFILMINPSIMFRLGSINRSILVYQW